MPRRSPGPLRHAEGGRRQGGRPGGHDGSDEAPAPLGGLQSVLTRDGEFHVRQIPGAAARKDYRCPGCSHEILSGTAHVVVWPAQDVTFTGSAVEARRHWHRSCWDRRAARGGPGRPG